MRYFKGFLLAFVFSALIVMGACSSEEASTEEEVVSPVNAKLLTFSNDSPHITVIDAESKLVIQHSDVPDFTKWTWNDDNNYFDGQNVWLGLKFPEADDAQVIALDVNTLKVTARLDVGKEKRNIYIGKATKNGILHVGKQASGEVVTIDTKNRVVLDTWTNMPIGGEGGVVCDADVGIGPDGIERFYYPTLAGDSVVSINVDTGATIKEVFSPEGAKPVMHTNAPDGRMWVQENGSHTNAVYDPVSLELIKRFPAAQRPIVATFSPDGKLAYIGHSGDPIVQVVDTATFTDVARVTVGNTPSKIAVHPNGRYIYAIASKEGTLAVIDTQTWAVVDRITLYNNPGGLFLWTE